MNKNNVFRFKLQQQTGFTLIEVIVVMAIIGIMAAIAIPSFMGFTDSSKVTSATNDLVSALNLARSEAVTRGTNVTVCKSADQATCNTAGTNWQQGWIVFTDADADGVVDGGVDTVLRVYQSPGGKVVMTAAANLANRITYANTGFLASTAANDLITVVAGNSQLNVEVTAMGRVSSSRP